jgi:hypothetical protein
MKKLPRFFWTGNGTWTRMNANPKEQRMFSNVSATKRSRRRRVCALHPTVLSSPSFTPQLYHRTRTSLKTHKCPDFKMQKRRKKVSPFYWDINCTALDKRNNVTSENRSVYSPRCTLSVECVTPPDLWCFFFEVIKLSKFRLQNGLT